MKRGILSLFGTILINFAFAQLCNKDQLQQAISKENFQPIKKCLNNGFDINTSIDEAQNTLLHLAIEYSKPEMAKLLLQNKANPNQTRGNGSPPLFVAVNKNDFTSTQYLVEHQANLNLQRTNDGTSALIIAAQWSSPELVQLLIDNGAKVNLRSSQTGISPLLMAAFGNRKEILQLLLENKADKTIKNISGWTVLHACVQGFSFSQQLIIEEFSDKDLQKLKLNELKKRCIQTIEYLMEQGASPFEIDYLSQNSIGHARTLELPQEIITVLESTSNLPVEKKDTIINPSSGHTQSVNSVIFSNDDQYYYSASSDQTIKKWNTKTKSEVFTITDSNNGFTGLDVHPTLGKLLSSAYGNKNNLKIWSTINGDLLNNYIGHKAGVTQVRFLNNGNQFISSSWDHTLKLWDTNSGEVLHTFQGHENEVNAFAISPDESILVSGGLDSHLIIWDLKNRQLIKKLSGHASDIRAVAISPGQEYIVSASMNGKLIIWEFESGQKLLETQLLGWVEDVLFYPKKNQLFVAHLGDLYVIDIPSGEKKSSRMTHMFVINSLNWSNDGNYLITGSNNKEIKIWNLEDIIDTKKKLPDLSLQPEQYQKNKTQTLLAKFVDDSKIIIGKHDASEDTIANNLMLLDLSYGVLFDDFIEAEGKVLDLAFNEKKGLVATGIQKWIFEQKDDFFDIKNQPEIKIWDINSFQLIHTYGGTGDMIQCLDFNKEGNLLLAGSNPAFSYTNDKPELPTIQVFDLEKKKMIQEIKDDAKRILAVAFTPGTNQIYSSGLDQKLKSWDIFSGNQIKNQVGFQPPIALSKDGKKMLSTTISVSSLSIWDIKDQKLQPLTGHEMIPTDAVFSSSGKYAVTGGLDRKLILWDIDQKKPFHIFEGHSDQIISVDISPNEAFLISTSMDNTLKIWDVQNQKLILTLRTIGDKDWMLQTPELYFTGTRGYVENISYAYDGKAFPFDQFDLIFNRPDLVFGQHPAFDEKLKKAYFSAYQKRLEKMGFTEKGLTNKNSRPTIKVKSSINEISTKEDELELQFSAADTGVKLERVNLFVNDNPIYGSNGLSLRNMNTHNYDGEATIQLLPGENKIQIYVQNQNGSESDRYTQFINVKRTIEKGNLHLITMAVSDFDQSSLNLKYPKKDAHDFIDLFQGKMEEYNQLIIDTLFNKDFNKKNLKIIKQKLMQTSVKDVVILYVASHGIFDDDFGYFIATPNSTYSSPSKNSVAFEQLEDLLDGIPARKKLFLMDACHAGEIDKENLEKMKDFNKKKGSVKFRSLDLGAKYKKIGIENSFSLMQELFVDLRRRTGASIIASASGVEFAQEADYWENSVFMYCIKNGLQEKAADKNKDGLVSVSELQQYLAKEVSNLTANNQRPTFRSENISYDWTVW